MSAENDTLAYRINTGVFDEPGLTREECLRQMDPIAQRERGKVARPLQGVPNRLIDPEFVVEACRLNDRNLYYVPYEDRTIEMCVAAIRGNDPERSPSQNGDAWRWVPDEIFQDVVADLGLSWPSGVGRQSLESSSEVHGIEVIIAVDPEDMEPLVRGPWMNDEDYERYQEEFDFLIGKSISDPADDEEDEPSAPTL